LHSVKRISPDSTGQIHPDIRQIADAMSFRIARLAALNEKSGSYHFKNTHDITLNQWRVLGLAQAMGPVESREIRDVLFMDKGQFSRVMAQLVQRGLITTTPAPGNASAVEVRTTQAGSALHDRLIAFTAERNEASVGVLSRAECAEFLRLLDKISAHNLHLHQLRSRP